MGLRRRQVTVRTTIRGLEAGSSDCQVSQHPRSLAVQFELLDEALDDCSSLQTMTVQINRSTFGKCKVVLALARQDRRS